MGGYRDTYFEKNSSNHGWYTCVRCGRKFRKGDMDIDHIIPQSYGGSNAEYNLQCMCKHCNRSKRDDIDDTIPDLARNAGRIMKRDAQSHSFSRLFKK